VPSIATPAPPAQAGDRPPRSQKWPDAIWIARHGQSAGNVARDAAEAGGQHLIDIATRDVDVPLSALGQAQAGALSRWFASMDLHVQPQVVLASPYVRALDTARTVADALSGQRRVPVVADERLREKEFGILDRMTVAGIRSMHPALSEQRRHVGKFYFRPPGGESWCDVILRLRSVLDTLTREYVGERVLIVAHQVVVNCFRYLFERMTESEVLALDRAADVPNCGVTLYEFDPAAGHHGKLVLRFANFLAPLEHEGTPVTRAPDVPAAPKP